MLWKDKKRKKKNHSVSHIKILLFLRGFFSFHPTQEYFLFFFFFLVFFFSLHTTHTQKQSFLLHSAPHLKKAKINPFYTGKKEKKSLSSTQKHFAFLNCFVFLFHSTQEKIKFSWHFFVVDFSVLLSFFVFQKKFLVTEVCTFSWSTALCYIRGPKWTVACLASYKHPSLLNCANQNDKFHVHISKKVFCGHFVTVLWWLQNI